MQSCKRQTSTDVSEGECSAAVRVVENRCCDSRLRCRWRVYAPLSPELVLRRDCSPDFTDADIGDPVLEVILQPGVRPRTCILLLCFHGRQAKWTVLSTQSESASPMRLLSQSFQGWPRSHLLSGAAWAQDLLYMPRGTIHQAEALDAEHSLHVTVSVNQARPACACSAINPAAGSSVNSHTCPCWFCTRVVR